MLKYGSRTLSTNSKMKDGYLAMAADDPKRWIIVEAAGEIKEVQVAIRELISERLQQKLERRQG